MGIALLTAAALIWGLAFVAQSLGMRHMGPFTFMASRFLLGGFTLLPVLALMRPSGPQKPPAELKPLILGGLACGVVLFISASFQQIGICYTTAGKAGFITTLYIVIVPLLGLAMGKKISPFLWACIAAALAGAYLLCVQGPFSLGQGDVLILFCAVFFAVHIVLIDRFVSRVNAVALACAQFFVCGLASAVMALLVENIVLAELIKGWAPILYTGVLSSAGAYTFQILGQRSVKPAPAALILSLEAVFAALSGWLILGESFSTKERVGAAILFAAIVAAQLPGPRGAQKPAPRANQRPEKG